MEREVETSTPRSPTFSPTPSVPTLSGPGFLDATTFLCLDPDVSTTMRILIVDDDAVFRDELGQLLRTEGHPVQSAPSVAKAIEVLEQEEFDVVLTDLKMPRQNGMVLLREVRRRWPRTLVIMVTGYATVETALEAMKLGAFDYIRKPFEMEQVHEVLSLASQEREAKTPVEALRDPAAEAMRLGGEGGYDVLYLAPTKPELSRHMHYAPLDAADPSRAVGQIDTFLQEYPKGAVVIAGVERWLEGHRAEDIIALLEQLREKLSPHGPLRVAFDPRKVSSSVALAIMGAVSAYEVRDTLDALANPIRKKVLERLATAPAPFGELMRSAGVDDTPKMAFHLRKLVDYGLLRHLKEAYELTERGRATVRLLEQVSLIPPSTGDSSFAFPTSDTRRA